MSETEKTQLSFSFKPVKKLPTRKYVKGSKYDPVVDGFIAQEQKLVEVAIEGKEPNYIRTQLMKRIDARDLGDKIEAVTRNNKCFLQKK